MLNPDQTIDPTTLALAALGWILEDQDRAVRLLAITGLDAEGLRTGLADPALLAAILEFLANYEPDLIRCAEALAITPEELASAIEVLRS